MLGLVCLKMSVFSSLWRMLFLQMGEGFALSGLEEPA